MLLLLFHIKNDRYALSSEVIHEVIPYLTLQQLPMSPGYVCGAVNYRGTQLPVVDLCLLINDEPCSQLISSRIIVTHFPINDNSTKLLGLLAEQVTETIKMPKGWRIKPTDSTDPHFIDEKIIGHSSYQWFDPAFLLPATIRDFLQPDILHNE